MVHIGTGIPTQINATRSPHNRRMIQRPVGVDLPLQVEKLLLCHGAIFPKDAPGRNVEAVRACSRSTHSSDEITGNHRCPPFCDSTPIRSHPEPPCHIEMMPSAALAADLTPLTTGASDNG